MVTICFYADDSRVFIINATRKEALPRTRSFCLLTAPPLKLRPQVETKNALWVLAPLALTSFFPSPGGGTVLQVRPFEAFQDLAGPPCLCPPELAG